MRTTDYCCVCGRGPLRLSHLYDHLRKEHRWDEGQIEQKKAEYEQKRNVGKDSHKCDICNKIYHTIKNLRQHKKEAHANSEAESDIGCVTYPECRHKFLNNFDLAMHCTEHHRDEIGGQNFRLIKGEFPSMQEFESWKESLERSETTNFAKRCSKPSKDGRRHYYVCKHACGMGAEVNAEELRDVYGKSKRVHSHCPAFLKVVEQEDGTVKYEGCVGHLGHLVSSATLRLSTSDENEIVNMLKSGLDAHSVLIKIRREKWDFSLPAENQARICYINLKDIWRIAERHGLIAGRSDPEDLKSMEELLKRDDIAGYKYVKSSDPSGDGFSLAIVTQSGKEYLERFGYRGLVFDDTFHVTRYSFRLATLLVTDDAGNGFPCGFLLSFRMTSDEIAMLFEVVRDLIPHFDTQYVMTDDCGSFYNGFRAVFPANNAQKILCKFHLGQSIGRKLKEHLLKEDAADGKAMFHEVLNEALPLEFERAYSAFMTWLETKSDELVSYMEFLYSARRREWAPCYRPRTPFSTSNYAESWHKALKHEVLKEKQNCRLDSLVFVLLEYALMREMSLLTQILRGTTGGYTRSSRSLQKHKDALYHYANDTGNSHCEKCGACAFRIRCTCPDSMNPGVACIHAHAVATFSASARALLPPVQHRLASCITSYAGSVRSASSVDSVPSYDVQLDGDDTDEAGLITDEEISAPSTGINPEIERSDITKEAYHRFEGVDAYMHELMRSCLKKNLHEFITEVTETLTAKTKEVAEKAGINCETARRPVVQLSERTPKPKPIEAYKTRGQQKAEKRQRTKAEQSQSTEPQKKRVVKRLKRAGRTLPRASSVVNEYRRTLEQKTYSGLAAPTYLCARHGRMKLALED